MNRSFLRSKHTFSQLQGILSKMKVSKDHSFPREMAKFGNTEMFSYATSKDQDKSHLKSKQLEIWNKLYKTDLNIMSHRVPLNGFEEMIQWTEDGKLWNYPIDNEFGLDEEKKIPFEDHVFLDKHLEDFPKNENIRSFMGLVIMGLSSNPFMTVDRKMKVIDFYKGYFKSKRDTYRQTGFDIE